MKPIQHFLFNKFSLLFNHRFIFEGPESHESHESHDTDTGTKAESQPNPLKDMKDKGAAMVQKADELGSKCEKTTKLESWNEESAKATDKDDAMYNIYTNGKKEVFYKPPYVNGDLLYSRAGNLIGFVGTDKNIHFHEPDNGWPKGVKKQVGTIANKYEGSGSIPDYSKYKTPKTEVKH